jgi:hypothetical protein
LELDNGQALHGFFTALRRNMAIFTKQKLFIC